jgi:Peptidase family M48/CAAX prenyl protease N-terminal, five membrane helices
MLDAMPWLTWIFLIAVVAETLTRLWLAGRQIGAVQVHRDEVPALFRGQIALADQQKAADYTTARVRLGRWATLVEALVKLGLTLGGGLAAVDALWSRTGFDEPWRGACVAATVLLVLQLVGLAAEIEAVLAHELGHFRLHHVRQRLAVSVVLALGGLALLAWLAAQPGFYGALGVPVPSAVMALLLFVLAVPVITFFATPAMSWWSRRHERQADDFAAQYADAGKLAAALIKLFRDNAATLTPDRIHSAFFDSHPPALERIGRLNALVAPSA